MAQISNETKNFQKLIDIFHDYNDIKDIQTDLKKLDSLYQSEKYYDLSNHISEIVRKHPAEAKIWDSINKTKSKAIRQKYLSARMFLYTLGCKNLLELGVGIKDYLTEEEYTYIESMIKPME